MMHSFKLRFDGRGLQLTGVADVYGQDKPEWAEDLLRKTLALTFPGDEGGVQITLMETLGEERGGDIPASTPGPDSNAPGAEELMTTRTTDHSSNSRTTSHRFKVLASTRRTSLDAEITVSHAVDDEQALEYAKELLREVAGEKLYTRIVLVEAR